MTRRIISHLKRGSPRGQARGFTLLEIIVVVLIIAVLALIAVPSVSVRLKERRSQEVAQRVTSFYRTARMRAMGRGSAVLVRFASGRVEVREARVGNAAADAQCAPLPSNSCLNTTWDPANADNQRVAGEIIDPAHYPGVKIDAYTPAGAVVPALTANLDVCFTPMGRTFFRTNPASTFLPLTGTAAVNVYRTATGGAVRRVLLLPNGSARLAL